MLSSIQILALNPSPWTNASFYYVLTRLQPKPYLELQSVYK